MTFWFILGLITYWLYLNTGWQNCTESIKLEKYLIQQGKISTTFINWCCEIKARKVSVMFYMLAGLAKITLVYIQWNPSYEATHFASEKWPFKRGGLMSGVKINTFLRFTSSSDLSRGSDLSSEWLLKRGSTVDL